MHEMGQGCPLDRKDGGSLGRAIFEEVKQLAI